VDFNVPLEFESSFEEKKKVESEYFIKPFSEKGFYIGFSENFTVAQWEAKGPCVK
jgi:hypothetical protein